MVLIPGRLYWYTGPSPIVPRARFDKALSMINIPLKLFWSGNIEAPRYKTYRYVLVTGKLLGNIPL